MTSDNQWAFDLETKIFSVIKSRAEEKIKLKYPNAYLTNISKAAAKATFPTIYIHEMPGAEMGADLEGVSVNGIRETFQVDITTNTSQSDAKRVMSIVADEFKKMRFQITSMPEFGDTGDTYRSTARFSRVIGANDIL